MSRRWLGALLLVSWVLVGAAPRPFNPFLNVYGKFDTNNAEPAYVTSGFSIYVLGDLHWTDTWGYGETQRYLTVDAINYINNDPTAAGLVVTGDFAHNCFTGSEGYTMDKFAYGYIPVSFVGVDARLHFIDSINVLLKDTLSVDVYPVVGNWEWAKLSGSGVAGTSAGGQAYDEYGALDNGRQFNDWTRRYGEFFQPFVSSPNDRGRRHYGLRLKTRTGQNTNVILFSFYNVNTADSARSTYWGNQPSTGYEPNSRFGKRDFDGYHDTTSAQRVDFKRFLEDNYEAGDWLAIAGHRPFKSFINDPRWEDSVAWSAGHGLINWMKHWTDTHDLKRYFALAGDTHENLWFKHPDAQYFQIHSTVAMRNMTDYGQIADSSWTGTDLPFYSNLNRSSVAYLDSLGSGFQGTWIVLTRMYFMSADSVRLDAIAIQRSVTPPHPFTDSLTVFSTYVTRTS